MSGTATTQSASGYSNSYAWSFRPGMWVRVTSSFTHPLSGVITTTTEDVEILSINYGGNPVQPVSFTARFNTALHPTLTQLTVYGNPGPTLSFNPHASGQAAILPHYSLIE